MSQAGANSSSGGGGGSGIETINTIGPDGGGNFTLESTDGSVTFTPIANGLDLSVPAVAGVVATLTGNSGGPISPLGGNINTVGAGSITTIGSGHTLTTELTGLTNHSLLVGGASTTLTNLGVATNGQIPIGSTGADPVLALPTSTGGTLTITPGAGTLNFEVANPVSGLTFDIDNGGPIHPVANVVTLNGVGGNETNTTGAGEIQFNNRRWITSYVVDPSSTPGTDGTFTTVQAGINAAFGAGGGDVYVRSNATPYTENLTLQPNVNIIGTGSDGRIQPFGGFGVIIAGNHTFAAEGATSFKNIELTSAAGTLITITNTVGITLCGFLNCQVSATGNFGSVSGTGTAAILTTLDSGVEATGILCTTGLGGTFSGVNSQVQTSGTPGFSNSGEVFLSNCVATASTVMLEMTDPSSGCSINNSQLGGGTGILFTTTGGANSNGNIWNCSGVSGFYIDGVAGTYNYNNDTIQGSATAIAPGITQNREAWRPRATAIPSVSTGGDYGTAAFDSAAFTVTDGWVQLIGGGGATTTYDIDVGGPVNSVAGVLTLNGLGGNQTVTSGAGEIGFNNLYWQTSYVVDPSTTPGSDASFQTIQSAINAAIAASQNVNIFIRTGTYTENLTLSSGINLIGVADGRSAEFGASNANVTQIIGNHTLNSTGGVLGIQNLAFFCTTTDPIFSLTSSGVCEVGISSCLAVNQSTGPIATVDNTGVGTFTLFAFQNSLGATSGTEGIILTGGGSIALGLAQVSTNGNVVNVQGSPAIFNVQNSNLTGGGSAPFACITFSSTIGFMGLLNNSFDGYSGVLGTGGSAGIQSLNNLWSCQSGNGFYIDTDSGASTITYNYVNDQADGSATQIDPLVNQDPLSWRPRATAGNSGTAYAGTASFDSTAFTVTDGFVQLNGGGGLPAIVTLDGDTGSATGSTITVFANNAAINAGSSVAFVASGSQVQLNVSDIGENTMIGTGCGTANMPINAVQCTGLGWNAMNAGNSNTASTAIGAFALNADATGSDNTSIGCQSLIALNGGLANIALGFQAGNAYTSTESSNITIGNVGVVGESNIIRIGTQGAGTGQQNECFIAGITGVTVSSPNFVTINTSTGQLGTTAIATSFVWNTTSTNIANMAVENGYFCVSPGGALTLGLPATSALGDTIRVSLAGATSFQITQAAGQQIRLGSNTTTLGATGTLTSTAQGDSVELVCLTANAIWVAQSSIGNLTLA